MLQQPHDKAAEARGDHDALIRSGVSLFNAGEWYACHDVFEHLWRRARGPHRDIYKAFVQIAAGLYHAEHGNGKGAARLLGRADELFAEQIPGGDADHAGRICEEVGLFVLPVMRWVRELVQHRLQDGADVSCLSSQGNGIPVLIPCGGCHSA